MGLKENNLRNSYTNNLTPWQRAWRCNSGAAWAGEFVEVTDSIRKIGIKLFFPVLIKLRKVELWPTGTPDLIGFDSIIITPDMVGKRVAVFKGVELKATKQDKLKPEQTNFKKLIVDTGGIHHEVREDGRVIESGFMIKKNT
jgi:hypothetical protein